MKCPTCRNLMESPRELADGLPGIKYRACQHCGTTRAVTRGESKGHMTCQYPQD